MKLTIGVKLFIAYFIVTSSIVWLVADKVAFRITNGIDQAAEEIMIDSANLLAQMVSNNIHNNEISTEKISNIMSAYLDREVNATIFSVNKKKPNLQIYITNKDGIVIYDSKGEIKGKDYSQWRDVFLTLKGEYGARSSAYDANILEPTADQKAHHVAAPIYHNNQIFGSLTVIKSVADLKPYVLTQKDQINTYAIYILLVSLLFGAGVSVFVTRSTRKLVKYTTALSKGENAVAPKIRQVEFADRKSVV